MNPYKYYKTPQSSEQAQSNINYWWYESMVDDSDIEAMGHFPVHYRTYIHEMARDARREHKNLSAT